MIDSPVGHQEKGGSVDSIWLKAARHKGSLTAVNQKVEGK
jgi:hypothetical protein